MCPAPHSGTPRGHAATHRWLPLLAVLSLGGAPAACSSTRDSGGPATTSTGHASSTTTIAPANVGFSSTGTERDGLSWLEDEAAVAHWQLTDLPTEPADLAVDVRAVIPADAIADDGTGTVGFTYGQDDRVLATQDLILPAVPLGDDAGLAMLSGSTIIATSDLSGQFTEMWVELATSPSGPSSLGVAPGSLTVGAAPAALDSNPVASPPIPAATPSTTRLDGELTTNGDLISGWYWVRDAALTHYAHWDFPAVPNLAGGVTAQLHVLATDGYGGGPGVDARYYFSYGFLGNDGAPLAQETELLVIPNVSPSDDPVGYTAQDTWTLDAEHVPLGAVGMWFEATRHDPGRLGEPTTEHVAFNAASIGLLIVGDGTGDDTGDDTGNDDSGNDGTSDDDGNADTDGSVLDDPDGLADADSTTDADDVGDLPPGTYHGTLDGENEDWFAFQLDGTQLVDFSIDTATGLFISVELHNPSNDIRAPQPQEIGAHTFSHAAGRSDGGRWYFHFVRLQGEGTYTFTFVVRDANDGLLHLDAGDTFDTATSVGVGDLLGELRYDDPADYYEVDVVAGRTLTATVETTTATTEPTAWNASFEVELRDAELDLLTDDNAYPDQPASLFLETDGSDRTVFIRIERYSGVGGPYRLRIAISGAGECGDTAIAATDFRSGGEPKGIVAGLQDGWFWMETEPAAARGQTSTWAFDRLPDDSAVRVMIDVRLDRTVDPNDGDAWLGAWPPMAAAAYFSYGIVTDEGSVAVGGPQFVTLNVVSRSGSGSGFAAVGELDIAHAELGDADAAWWIRVGLIDPSAPRPARAPTAIGVSSTSLMLCAGGPVEELDGFDGPVEPPAITVTYDATSRTMTSDASMFVEPATDVDGDGLHQGFENQALAFANPIIALDEEELWQYWLDDAPTVNFVQATLWPSYANPQYVVLGYLNTWAYDAGGGAQAIDVTQEAHRGDSERIWEAWKIVDDRTMTLEWVNTSAHASYTEHSGIWHASDRQCTKAYVAKVFVQLPSMKLKGDWGFFEVMCDDLEFSDDGRVVMHSAENKHAMYPSGATCESISVGADIDTGIRLWGEDCDWVEPPLPIDTLNYSLWLLGWHDDDFDDDPQYKGFGRWLFDVYNVGEPGYPLIDDLDEPTSWIGLTPAQVAALTGLYPTEAVWTGHDDFSRFCGGLEEGDVLAMPWYALDKVMPDDPKNCSTKLGGKFTTWQPMFIDAMASRYRVTLATGTPTGAGTDDVVVIDLHDADGTLLATEQYNGELENGSTDIVYLPSYGLGNGGDLATVSIRRAGTDNGVFPDWYLQSVTVQDLANDQTATYVVDQWITSGAGIVLGP